MKKRSEGKLKIVFVGIPDMALVCLSNLLAFGFNIVGVVPPLKNNETYPFFKNFVLNKGLNLIEFENSPNDLSYINKIKALNADIGVVCSYNNKLSNDFLKTTRLGYINSHPSLLPQYRGAMPYFHVINNGEKRTGITLHFMNEKFDCGDIIYQKSFEISPYDTMGTIFNQTNYMISDGLIEILGKIENEEPIELIPQEQNGDFKRASVVSSVFRIDFKNEEGEALERLIRACNPFYQAYCLFRGVRFQVLKAHFEKKKHNFEFGKIAQANEKVLKIANKGGFLYLDFFQVGSWGFFSPLEFYKIFKPQEDEVLN